MAISRPKPRIGSVVSFLYPLYFKPYRGTETRPPLCALSATKNMFLKCGKKVPCPKSWLSSGHSDIRPYDLTAKLS